MFKGSIVALITPFRYGKVDEDAFQKLVEGKFLRERKRFLRFLASLQARGSLASEYPILSISSRDNMCDDPIYVAAHVRRKSV